MILHFYNYGSITFPVYRLPNDNLHFIDGLLFLDGLLLDDKNMPGETLGARRLQTPQKGKFPLKIMLNSFVQLIKYTQGNYIDSVGKVFYYEKTIFFQVKYYRITKVERKVSASLLWVKGINFPFTIPRPPDELTTYAGILHYKNIPWLLYDYSNVKLKPIKRKV